MWDQITDAADPAHVSAVLALAGTATPPRGEVVVIAVVGPSGSGKTTLARAVADALGAPIAHMDEIFPGWDGLAAAVPLVVAQVLEPVARGEQAAYRVWDWARDDWGGTLTLPRHRFLVLEGCGSSVGPARPYAAVRVWVDAPRTERMARGIARDGEAFRPHWERWAAQEDALYAADRTAEHAHLRLQTGRPS